MNVRRQRMEGESLSPSVDINLFDREMNEAFWGPNGEAVLCKPYPSRRRWVAANSRFDIALWK